MTLDAIIIAETETSTFSATNPLKLSLDGRVADIQSVVGALTHRDPEAASSAGAKSANWASAPKSNGLFLLDSLARNGIEAVLIGNYGAEKERFERLLDHAPKAVVISTTFITHKRVLGELVDDIRRRAPAIPIIVGGPFVYSSYIMFKRRRETEYDTESAAGQFLFLKGGVAPRVDLYVVSQRGEHALLEALKRLKTGKGLQGIANTATGSAAGYDFARREDDVSGPETPPMDWASLPESLFESGVVPLQASTGCPFNCAFCNFIKDRRLNRVRSTDAIVADMKAVARRGARYVWFVDDNFRLGKKDLGAVCRRLIRENLGLKWMTFVRADALVHEDIDLLRDAGCTEVQLGLESADPQILKNMNKGADPDTYHRALEKLRSAGINCSCYFIFGFPGETEKSAERTRQFILSHDRMALKGTLAVSLFPFVLSPLSPIYEPKARAPYGLSGYMQHWRHRTMDDHQAIGEIMHTFESMEHTGAIYRSDDLDLLARLTPQERAAFHATRHRLAKAALQSPLSRQDTLSALGRAIPRRLVSDPVAAPPRPEPNRVWESGSPG